MMIKLAFVNIKSFFNTFESGIVGDVVSGVLKLVNL